MFLSLGAGIRTKIVIEFTVGRSIVIIRIMVPLRRHSCYDGRV